jgi:hypothetical protein
MTDRSCALCGHAESRHDVIAPSTDHWKVCYDCPSNRGHAFRAGPSGPVTR